MSSIAETYKAVCNKLLGKDVNKSENLCCVCLNAAGEDALSVNDKVSLDFDPCENVLSEELMSRIILHLAGDAAIHSMSIFQSICKKCSLDAITAVKFIKKCKVTVENLHHAVNDLENCIENVSENAEYETLYISVNPTLMTVQQFYDVKKLDDSPKTALARFKFIAYGRKHRKRSIPGIQDSDEETNRRIRDFSTIFIKTHELVADPNKPKEYKCKMCLKLYPSSGNLRQHFFSTHFKKEFQCPECHKCFGTAGLLQTHIQISHQLVECSECGKKLLNRTSTLKRHSLTHQRVAKICYKCGKKYKKGKDFERHLAQETCEMPSRVPGSYTCDTCGYHSIYKNQLLTHIKYEHSGADGHVCKWCNRKCYSSSALKTHILKHTKERNHTCVECGGKFVTKQSLTNHMRLHTGERPYKCDLCDSSFLSASRRKDHIERYHSDGTYDCDLCPAKYSARRSLVNHRKRHFVTE